MFPKLRRRMTEREVCRIFELECFTRGVDKMPRITAVSGRGGYTRPYGVPADKVLSEGDLLFIDAGCLFNLYWSDFNRHFAFGAPGPHTQDAYQVVWNGMEAGIAAVKPGRPICDIRTAMSDVLNSPENRGKASTIGRMGHSMGLWMPELPSVHPKDRTILKRMIVNIEPSTTYPSYFDGSPKLMVHEDVVVVIEDGAQLLKSVLLERYRSSFERALAPEYDILKR